jgi:hypothetical protein
MAIPTGVAAQLGIKTETTHGTPVTVDRFYEFTSESLSMDVDRMESSGLRAGTRVLRSDRWVAGSKTVGGDVEMELANKSFGLWLQHMFGSVATSQPAVATDPTVYEHTFTPGDLPVGFTAQVGRPSSDGTVQPFTYEGCVIPSWELSASVDEIGKVKATVDGEDELTGTALATASYPTGLSLLTFTGATLTIAAGSVDVTGFSVSGSNALETGRRKLGSDVRKAPVEAAMREYTGTMDAYFDSLTAYQRFVNGTEAALTANFTGAIISNAYAFALEVTANVRFDGETPTVGGPDELMQALPFKCLDTGTGPETAITAVYRTTDTTP